MWKVGTCLLLSTAVSLLGLAAVMTLALGTPALPLPGMLSAPSFFPQPVKPENVEGHSRPVGQGLLMPEEHVPRACHVKEKDGFQLRLRSRHQGLVGPWQLPPVGLQPGAWVGCMLPARSEEDLVCSAFEKRQGYG